MDMKVARKVVTEYKRKGKTKEIWYNASFTIVNNDKSVIDRTAAPCYGYLKQLAYLEHKYVPEAIICKIKPGFADKTTSNAAPLFFEWLFNYSPFKDIFITKSAKKVIDNGAFVVKTDVDANFLMSGLIASRCIQEVYSEKVYQNIWTWKYLVERGVDPTLAFAYAHSIRFENDGGRFSPKSKIETTVYASGHEFINLGHQYAVPIFAFCQNTPKLTSKTYKEAQTYGSVYSVWDNYEGVKDITGKERDLIKYIERVVEGGTSKNTNPFDLGSNNKSYVFGEFFESAIPALREIGAKYVKHS